jgi:hypothetical protein
MRKKIQTSDVCATLINHGEGKHRCADVFINESTQLASKMK